MLAYVAGSISTDLNVWEKMACPCVSQAVCHSATTASVVWLLALDFTFTRCVSPCPWNFNIGCCANEKPLRLIAHRRRSIFHVYVCINIGIGGRGGTHWIQFKLRKILWFWRLMTVPPQFQHDIEKNGVWSLILAWWRTKRVSCFAGWRMELYADIHLHWEIFFLVPRHFFWVWTVVSLSTEAIF